MDELLKMVKSYRFTSNLAERQQLAESIFSRIEPELASFVFRAVDHSVAEDVLQESLAAITSGLDKFIGNTKDQFWGWCYRITRNKLNGYFRKKMRERLQQLPPDELLKLVDESISTATLSAADKHDFDQAMKLLANSKPECGEVLRSFFILGQNYDEIAEERKSTNDAVRLRIRRCLETARSLMS